MHLLKTPIHNADRVRRCLIAYLTTLACVWAIQIPLFAAVDKCNGVSIRRDSVINGVTGTFSEINGIAIAATPTATATSTPTATATVPSDPELVSAEVLASGEELQLTFNVAMTSSDWGTYSAIFTFVGTSANIDGYSSGDGTTVITLVINHGPVLQSESLLLNFTCLAFDNECIEAVSGGANLANFTDFPVTNSSTQ